MKKFTVLIIALLLIISFCSCKSQSNIPVINTSEQSDSSDITESQVENSKPVISNTSSTQSTPKENSSKPSSNIESSTPSASSNSSTPVPNKPEEPVTKQDFKICYAQLTDKQKSIYNTLEKAVKDMETGWISLETPVYTNYRRDINIIVAALQTDMPQYFWIPPAYYTGNSQDGETIRILFEGQDNLTYLIDKSDQLQMENALSRKVAEIMSQVTATTPFEIELQLHDILCKNVTYAKSTENPLVYTAYGALINGEAVCEGYSRAMQLLLAQYNIKSTLVTGDAKGEAHMWNLVNIDNAWYHLDVTWNDGMGTYLYFNLRDKEINIDHLRYRTHTELSYDEVVSETPKPYNFNLPVCDKIDNNYFVKKDYVYSPNGEEKIAKYLMQPFDRMEFRFSDDDFKELFKANKDTYLNNINELLIKEKSNFRITNYSITETTLIIYN
ncbi:MAG: hypothetical protein IKK77_02945 [Clostridia bacterium]|nr:hypothetical protein [Clostridia bacterium]